MRSSNADPESVHVTTVTDIQAVDEVLRGNREMFEVLVRRYNPQLFRVGMAYLRNHAMAEDAMQNTYIRAFQHLHQFRKTASFPTWITRIMINECLMTLRHQQPRATESLDDGTHEYDTPTVPVCDAAHDNEMKALLETAIAALPQNYRAAYVLREVQQLSTAETAEVLGISQESVKVLLHRARARLKDELLRSAAGIELFSYPAQYCNPMTERVLAIILALPNAQDRR